MGPPSKLVSAAELEELISANNFIVTFIGKEGEDFKTFEAAASTDDKWTFVHTFDEAAATKHGVTGNKVVIFRKFDENVVKFDGKFEAKDISAWISSHILPTVFELTEEYSE